MIEVRSTIILVSFDIYVVDLDPVKDLNLTKSAEPNTLIATWTDVERKVQCGIEYEITYGYDSMYETLRTNQSSLTFETDYCTTAFIRVRAISGSRESEMRSTTYTEGELYWQKFFLFLNLNEYFVEC